MEPLTEQEGVDPTPDIAAPEAPPAEVPPLPVASAPETTATTIAVDHQGDKIYPSLYDTLPTTVAAIAIGVGIIGGIQWTVRKIFVKEKADHRALTQFVTSMFALIVGVWIADKLIAGPTAELIDPGESAQLLTFIKDITLMVFSYYFGTKANVPADEPAPTDGGE
jgi:uncharacterized protein YneF (UPF0154 family)